MFDVSFFCYYANGSHTTHKQVLDMKDIPLWISSYKFTHPDCVAISSKIWFEE